MCPANEQGSALALGAEEPQHPGAWRSLNQGVLAAIAPSSHSPSLRWERPQHKIIILLSALWKSITCLLQIICAIS